MTTTSEGLIDTIVAVLKGPPNTAPKQMPTMAAADDIQPFRSWSYQTVRGQGAFSPRITFDLPREDKESLGRGGPASFTTVGQIMLRAVVCATSAGPAGSDGGEVRVRKLLLQFRRQIEIALINSPELMSQIQQIKAIRSEARSSTDENGFHIGELGMQIALEFYQGPEDFFQPTFDDLDDVALTVTVGADTVAKTDIILST